jgi:hypothetical protein
MLNAQIGKLLQNPGISCLIPIDLDIPELRVACRSLPPRALMTMPETAVHEDGEADPTYIEIRLSG